MEHKWEGDANAVRRGVPGIGCQSRSKSGVIHMKDNLVQFLSPSRVRGSSWRGAGRVATGKYLINREDFPVRKEYIKGDWSHGSHCRR